MNDVSLGWSRKRLMDLTSILMLLKWGRARQQCTNTDTNNIRPTGKVASMWQVVRKQIAIE